MARGSHGTLKTMTDATLSVVRRSEPILEGEDVPLQATYTDDQGAAIAPGGVTGGTGPTVTVTAPDGTTVVDAVVMAEEEVGTYEHVWDTAADATDTGKYVARASAELNGETDIEKTTVEINP